MQIRFVRPMAVSPIRLMRWGREDGVEVRRDAARGCFVVIAPAGSSFPPDHRTVTCFKIEPFSVWATPNKIEKCASTTWVLCAFQHFRCGEGKGAGILHVGAAYTLENVGVSTPILSTHSAFISFRRVVLIRQHFWASLALHDFHFGGVVLHCFACITAFFFLVITIITTILLSIAPLRSQYAWVRWHQHNSRYIEGTCGGYKSVNLRLEYLHHTFLDSYRNLFLSLIFVCSQRSSGGLGCKIMQRCKSGCSSAFLLSSSGLSGGSDKTK